MNPRVVRTPHGATLTEPPTEAAVLLTPGARDARDAWLRANRRASRAHDAAAYASGTLRRLQAEGQPLPVLLRATEYAEDRAREHTLAVSLAFEAAKRLDELTHDYGKPAKASAA